MDDAILFAKNRDRKIAITDIAIDKIPRLEYKGLSDSENEVLYKLAKLVLLISQNNNDSNEVAATCTLDAEDSLEVVGLSYGDEHEVDACSDVGSKMCHCGGSQSSIYPNTFFGGFEILSTFCFCQNNGCGYKSRDDILYCKG